MELKSRNKIFWTFKVLFIYLYLHYRVFSSTTSVQRNCFCLKRKKMTTERQKKVKSILISQPEPENKTPYHSLAEKHKLKLHYRSFVRVDELSTIEFREQRISLLNHDAVIFTSKNSMDHYFGMMEKLRLRVPWRSITRWKTIQWSNFKCRRNDILFKLSSQIFEF